MVLLDNALKYTPFEGSVALSLTTQDQYALIRVSDTGIGILPEDLPHIFERFYRADPARSRDRGGSGLGLAIARSIVEEHDGSIEVESTSGKGSTFVVKLPVLNKSVRYSHLIPGTSSAFSPSPSLETDVIIL